MAASTLSTLPRPRTGQPVRATDFATLAAAVERIERQLFADQRNERRDLLIFGVVEAVRPGPGLQVAGPVKYDVRLSTGALLVDVAPDLGRPVEPGSTTKIVPAAVGDKAVVVRLPDGEGAFTNFLILPERLRFKVCGG